MPASPNVPRHGLSDRLRMQTRQEHRAAERSLDLDRDLQSPDRLARLLDGWAAVWSQVAMAVADPAAGPGAGAELALAAAQSLDWLRWDLDRLGAPARPAPAQPAPAPARPAPPPVATPEATWLFAGPDDGLGAAYVLRGSRLGGTVLAGRVRAAGWAVGTDCLRFLSSHGTDPGRDWVAFRRRLDAWGQARGPGADDAVVAAARQSFGWVDSLLTRSLRPTGTSRTHAEPLTMVTR